MAATQRISGGFPFPAYVNETANSDRIAPGVYVDETSGTTIVTSVGSISVDIAVAGVGKAIANSVGTIGIDIAVAGTGKAIANVAGSVGIDIAVSGMGAATTNSVGSIGIDIAVAGDANVASSGGHFLPVTAAQRKADEKRRKRIEALQSQLEDEKRLDKEDIAVQLRRALRGPEQLEPTSELVEEDHDDDDVLEILLLHG